MPVTLYFIRHGESEANVFDSLTRENFHELMKLQCFESEIENILQDPCLTPKGIIQSNECSKIIDNLNIDHVFCSPLLRALQTAQYAFKNTHHQIDVNIGLREISWDCYESKGRLLDDLISGNVPDSNSKRPKLDTRKFTNLDSLMFESTYWNPTKERTMSELKTLEDENISNFLCTLDYYENKSVAAVCHSNLMRHLLNIEHINNCQVIKTLYSTSKGFSNTVYLP